MSNKTVPNLMTKLFASKFWPSFFPLHGRLWIGPGQQESGEVQEPHASICFSLGSNTSHKTNVLPQKLFFSQPVNSKDLLKKILHSLEDYSETWSPATFSPCCASALCAHSMALNLNALQKKRERGEWEKRDRDLDRKQKNGDLSQPASAANDFHEFLSLCDTDEKRLLFLWDTKNVRF